MSERSRETPEIEETRTTDVLPETKATLPEAAGNREDQTIGPYRLRRKLGEGGMGVVWEATQEEPVRRTVALKVIKWGMDTRQVVARFESERQALALMNHPAIAKVFDAGATPRGRPYFVMECVKGIPITEYCDKHRLSVADRLGLFTQVCRGVQHAHQRGIIHRDIKPSNILVSVEEGKPVPKIIDFGVAKATSQRLTEKSIYTEFGQLIGTPDYMSPEQAEMTGLDIDTRTDVYSLGVLLYELLTGTRPFDSRELREAGLLGIQRKIREQDPDRPSNRISRLSNSGDEETRLETQVEAAPRTETTTPITNVAAKRSTEPQVLRRMLKGDLDWIVMKAIDKDRTRRYESSSELAADVDRHLRHEPVVASPPSTAYRAKKFVLRHRLGVSAAAAVALVTLLGLAGTTTQWIRASRAEQAALQEAQTARQVSDFLVRLFEVSDPSQARGEQITAREILDRGAVRIERELSSQPVVEARLLQTVGQVYWGLGLWKDSVPLFDKALRVRESSLGSQHLETAAALDRLGAAKSGIGEYDEAEVLLRRALAIRENALGLKAPEVAVTKKNLANLYRDQGKTSEAEAVYKSVASNQEEILGPEHPDLAETFHELGWLLSLEVRVQEAEPYFERAVEIREKALGSEHPALLDSLVKLASVYRQEDKYDEAQATFLRVLPIQQKLLGPDHIDTATTFRSLGGLAMLQRRFDESDRYYQSAQAIYEKVIGTDHPDYAGLIHKVGELREWQGDFSAAAELYRETLRILGNTTGLDHPLALHTMTHQVSLKIREGRLDEAESLAKGALNSKRGYDQATGYYQLGQIRRKRGDDSGAEDAYQRAVTLYEGIGNVTHVATSLIGLGVMRWEEGRPEEALDFLKKARGLVVEHEPHSPRIAEASFQMGLVLQDLGRLEESLEAFQESLSVRENLYGAEDSLTGQSREAVVRVLRRLGRDREAAELVGKPVAQPGS